VHDLLTQARLHFEHIHIFTPPLEYSPWTDIIEPRYSSFDFFEDFVHRFQRPSVRQKAVDRLMRLCWISAVSFSSAQSLGKTQGVHWSTEGRGDACQCYVVGDKTARRRIPCCLAWLRINSGLTCVRGAPAPSHQNGFGVSYKG
jgi:hypothetical protein